MKNAWKIVIIVGCIIVLGAVFFLGRWSKQDSVDKQIKRLAETSDSLASRGERLEEQLRIATERAEYAEAENHRITESLGEALRIIANLESYGDAITSGSTSIESGLGDIADAIAGLIEELQTGQD